MASVLQLKAGIHEIGNRLVGCGYHCPGIVNDPENGILPRCLVLETDGRTNRRGSVVVGMNPGRAPAHERAWHKSQGTTYDDVVGYWNRYVGFKHRYYIRLRNLANQLGLSGPLLWTELAKCENAVGVRTPPLQTFRLCTSEFLNAELRLSPEDWPLIGVGGEAYKALAYLYPNRAVIGVPHPTGSWGHFDRLFDGGTMLAQVKVVAGSVWSERTPKTVWLSVSQSL